MGRGEALTRCFASFLFGGEKGRQGQQGQQGRRGQQGERGEQNEQRCGIGRGAWRDGGWLLPGAGGWDEFGGAGLIC
jgi:hypothetical protein